MPIEPAVSEWLAQSIRRFSCIQDSDVVRRRSALEAVYQEFMAAFPVDDPGRLDAVHTEASTFEFDGATVPLRIHRPPSVGPMPALLHLFGGAWWQRTFDAPDVIDTCRQMALDGNVTVVQLDYALAPEHPFPVALEQSHAALAHIAVLPGVDPDRLVVGGLSAGANLAAALCLLARDRGGPTIRLQVLEVPVLDLTMDRYDDGVHDAFPAVNGVERASSRPLREAIDWYLGGTDPAEPLVSPLRATDLSDLPEALILTAGYDPLWVEGRDYAEALAAAGTPATGIQFAGLIHSAPTLGALSASARAWRMAVVTALSRL